MGLIVGSRIRRGRGKAEDAYGAVVTRSRKVFVGWVESDPLDVTLVIRQRLQFFKSMAGPHHDFGIQSHGDEDGGIIRPSKVLDVIFMPDQSAYGTPVLNGRRFISSYSQ